MKTALALTAQRFESASHRTEEYLSWHRNFKRAFTKFLTEKGAKDIFRASNYSPVIPLAGHQPGQ